MIDIAHYVICPYCQEKFDRDTVPNIKIKNRYAHTACHEAHENELSQIDKDKRDLEEYIKRLLDEDYISPRVRKQINTFLEQYNYTYSGILKALIYFYEVKGNDPAKANHGIGIVPYCYRDAYNYYYALWLANEQNKDKKLEDYKPVVIEVRIPSPKRESNKRKFFTFLDEEEINGEK